MVKNKKVKEEVIEEKEEVVEPKEVVETEKEDKKPKKETKKSKKNKTEKKLEELVEISGLGKEKVEIGELPDFMSGGDLFDEENSPEFLKTSGKSKNLKVKKTKFQIS
jgi:hypothetical protein